MFGNGRGHGIPRGGNHRGKRPACFKCGQAGHQARNCPTNTSGYLANQAHRNNFPGANSRPPREPGEENGGKDRHDRKFPVFGFKRLYGFWKDDEPDTVIMAIGRNLEEWKELIADATSFDKKDDLFVLIIHILAEKVCQESILKPNQIQIITGILGDQFITKVTEKFGKLLMNSDAGRGYHKNPIMEVDQSKLRILTNLHKLFAFVALRLPVTSLDYVKKVLPGALGVIATSFIMSGISEEDKTRLTRLQEDYQELMRNIEELVKKDQEKEAEKKRFSKYGFTPNEEEKLHGMAPPDNFREIPVIPTAEEIKSVDEPFLRTNKKTGAYVDSDHYLDVQYRLLREDFVSPLKKGIQDFMKHRADYLSRKRKMPMGNVRIYPEVTICDAVLVKDTFTYSLQLPESLYKRVKWEKSKRLLQGSLLVLTADNFATLYFAVVARREADQLKKGIFGVSWEGMKPDLLAKEEFILVECEVYFEAYRHTLEILKTIELETFPLSKFIVQASSQVGPPTYLVETTHQLQIDDNYFSPLMGPWPNAKQLGLDPTQFEAFHAALTNEFAIIQGPPGTGKTYLGLKVAEVFLSNLEVWWNEGKGPILVVCYTNHALDQFLEGIYHVLKKLHPREDPAMIRVGGRSKSEVLDQFSLFRRRLMAGRMGLGDKAVSASKYEAMQTVRDYEAKRAAVMSEVMELGNLKGVINFESLCVWEKLRKEFPEAIWHLLKTENWLGLTLDTFDIPNFDADRFLRRWFNVRVNPQKQAFVPPKKPTATAALINQAQDSDDEDYDLDELLENRIVDDVYYYEAQKMEKSEGNGFKATALSYLPFASIPELDRQIKSNLAELETIQADKKLSPASKIAELEKLRKKIRILQNREDGVEKIFSAYKKGELDLPEVDGVLNQENMPEQILRFGTSQARKWAIFFYIVQRARVLTVQAAGQVDQLLIDAQKKLNSIIRVGDGRLLEKTKVVGMTTTGAAKHNDLLRMMKSKIVIVEEAAEVLESHIVTCITEYCQHLVLIGDHQQLRPSTTVYDLSTKYNLDISLFERMVNNNLNCHKLKVQHRMRPEICGLIVGTIYDELENHIRVYDYPEVRGMDKSLFFIDHHEHERSESDSMSKSNDHEAVFLASLCRHLILQGYSPSQITILTTYTGQMFLLKKEIGALPSCHGVRVTVVDNFQGEENDIILLSLVRSNDQNNIGFLKTDNRICVAISRAKHGLYICGNMSNLAAKSKTWQQIREKLLKRGEIGMEMDLVCPVHHSVTGVSNGLEFRQKSPEGGCSVMCDTILSCQHKCQSVCHVADREHSLYKCRQQCSKICGNNHQCAARCFMPCPPCSVKIMKTLPCQHELKIECHIDPATVRCVVPVDKQKPCGHSEVMACFKNPEAVKCKVKVTKTLRCQHEKANVECHVEADTITCKVLVTKTLIPCSHSQIAQCHLHADMIKCDTEVEKEFPSCKHKITIKCKDSNNQKLFCQLACPIRLSCGHACTRICHVDEDPHHLEYECKKECQRVCENGHPCATKHKCFQKCPPCSVKMSKRLPCGDHEKMMECKEDPLFVVCESPCVKRLPNCGHKCSKKCSELCEPCLTIVQKYSPCGHPQKTLCSEPASESRCQERVLSRQQSACRHEVTVPCGVKYTIQPDQILDYCKHPCGYLFDEKEQGCGHRCKGSCSECLQGRLHKKCAEECGKQLVCGHRCEFPCAAVCPPCGKKCHMKCEHSECSAPCGEPCTDCNEKCNWSCEHQKCTKLCREPCDRPPCDEICTKKLKCGHDCIGFCGEPCPPLCRICNKKELTEFVLYGFEEDDDARFVYLVDCKHCIEITGLDYYMNHEIEEGAISAKSCPRCKSLIRQSKRYGNILRTRLSDVLAVKKKVFGNRVDVAKKQELILKEVRDVNIGFGVHLPQVRELIINRLALVLPANISKGRNVDEYKLKVVDEGTMQSLELIATHGKDAIKALKQSLMELHPQLQPSLRQKYTQLFNYLVSRELPLSSVEIKDFDREFSRMFDFYQLYRRKSVAQFTPTHPRATPLYERAVTILSGHLPYSDRIRNDFRVLLKELDDSLKSGLGISDRERREILNAFNMRQGRWFKCPNGHIYIITECGGAMEEGRCNECNAVIGGGSHRLRTDNALAGEMDGATAPLWPQ